MQFKIHKKKFLEALENYSKFLSGYKTHPILENIKIIAEDHLTLIASDANTDIRIILNSDQDNMLQILEEGAIIIDSKIIIETCKKLHDDIIEVSDVDEANMVIVRDTGFRMNIPTSPERDYPNIHFINFDKSMEINGNFFIDINHNIAFASDENNAHLNLTGIYIKVTDQKLTAVACDNKRLSRLEFNIDSEQEWSGILKKKTVVDLTKAIKVNENLKFNYSGNGENTNIIQFEIANLLIQTRTIAQEYIDYPSLIPDNNKLKHILVVNVRNLKEALERATLIKRSGSYPIIKFRISDTQFLIENKDKRYGSSLENIKEYSYQGSEFEIFFNGNFLLDILKNFKDENINIGFMHRSFAFKVYSDDLSNCHIILPVKNNE